MCSFKKSAYKDLTEKMPDGVNLHLKVSSFGVKETVINFCTNCNHAVNFDPTRDRLNSRFTGGVVASTSATSTFFLRVILKRLGN